MIAITNQHAFRVYEASDENNQEPATFTGQTFKEVKLSSPHVVNEEVVTYC